jgi:hypothetical protein
MGVMLRWMTRGVGISELPGSCGDSRVVERDQQTS